jgi:putative FmdB family regulatory protein
MPLYDYKCSDCNKEFEVLVKNSNEKVDCTECGSSNIKRVYSSFDFNLNKKSESSCSTSSCANGMCGLR